MSTLDRLCLRCAHFSLDTGERGYSQETPGYHGSLSCNKGHFNFRGDGYLDCYKLCIERAATCPDYDERPMP